MTDKKITQLDTATTLALTDIIPVVIDPGGSPITKKITLSNLTKSQIKFLTYPLLSASWDGDSYVAVAATVLDLSAVFGVPAGVKAVLARVECRDSAAWGTTGNYVSVGPSLLGYYSLAVHSHGGSVKNSGTGVVPCDANGDIYYRIVASVGHPMEVWIEIWGYWL